MRLWAALALANSFSSLAWACPNLTGVYSCNYQNGTQQSVTLTQSVDPLGHVVYIYNGTPIPADNLNHPVADSDQLRGGQMRAWCDDNLTFKTELVGKYLRNGLYFGDITMDMNFSLNGKDLMSITTGAVKNNGQTFPLDTDLVCTRSQ